MIEVEVKYRIENVDEVEKKLLELGATYIGEKNEEDHYFQHPCRDFTKTDEALRVRKTLDKVEVTYKGPKISSRTKSRLEINVSVDDFNSTILLLEKLGFRRVFVVRKKRKEYILYNEIKISIDIVEGLGSFIEIELSSPEHSFNKTEEKILTIAKNLGLKGKPIIKSYLELLLEKNSKYYR